ncbi:MAG: dTDP-4-dehydrorhamnose reductase, partial [Bacteroidota bacterium]
MTSILVTGANGQVGNELQALAPHYPDFQLIAVDVQDLDITDASAVIAFFQRQSFDYCINCAAFTAVDRAESEAILAQQVNVEGSKHLAQACLLHQCQLLQLSTDYVYHNTQNTPFKEGDPTSPQSVYASTKLAGEQVAQQILPSTTIIRTSWVYSTFGHNFVKTMLRLGRERDQLSVVFDQIGTPTYARDLAKALLEMIHLVEQKQVDAGHLSGIYHYSNEGVTSWYDFAKAIFRMEQIQCDVAPI